CVAKLAHQARTNSLLLPQRLRQRIIAPGAELLLLLSVQKERKIYKLMKEYPIISTENYKARQYYP
ncbi:MAG: hypothetical protein IKB11_07190, partial [Bacteroidaceae bacterium]|nr:hypothetical protein [Bacteroidaceae bacterium]